MPFLPILLSKIKLHHVSELGVTCWVGWVCVGGVPPLVLFLPKVRRRWSMLSMALLATSMTVLNLLPSVHIYTKIWSPSLIHVRG